MRIWGVDRYALGVCGAFAILSGCGNGVQTPLAPSGSGAFADRAVSGAAQNRVVRLQPDHTPSWMAPGAASKDLLYVSNYTFGTVFVYTYPQEKLVGKLTGFANPDGLCTDKKGDVWIVNNDASQSGEDVVEYKHGGTKQVSELETGSGYAVSCSVDPTTGDLAATVLDTYSGGSGYVDIFKGAKGKATVYYTNPGTRTAEYFCGYDDKGNLYVDAAIYGAPFEFAELPKGASKFKIINLTGGTIHFPGAVHWDGKYVAVGDQQFSGGSFYETTGIYQTTGASGKIVGSTALTGSSDVENYWIDGGTVIGPDLCQNSCTGSSSVGFWKYPAGGKATKTIEKGWSSDNDPIGAAVSVAP